MRGWRVHRPRRFGQNSGANAWNMRDYEGVSEGEITVKKGQVRAGKLVLITNVLPLET